MNIQRSTQIRSGALRLDCLPLDVGLMKNWITSFFFPREIGRLSFLIRFLALFGAIIFVFQILIAIDAPRTPIGEIGYSHWVLLGTPFAIYNLLFITLPRIRHLRFPTWTVILALIPYLNGAFFTFLAIMPRRRALLSPSLGEGSKDSGSDYGEIESRQTPKPTSVAGSVCSRCGEALLLASEGVIQNDGTVICNDCRESEAQQGSAG